MLYISTKFCDIISNGIKVIELTRFLYRKLKLNVVKLSQTVSKLESGHDFYTENFKGE